MADKRITQIATTYDRDDLALATDYLIVDRSGGSSARILAEEAVHGVLENTAGPIIIASDVNVDDGTLFVDVSAKSIGIGTTSPAGRLHVKNGTIEFDPGAGSDETRAFNFNISNINYGKILLASGSGGAMAFWTGGANAAAERLRISPSGNVGIGTTSPSVKLQVAGAIAIADGMTAPSTLSGYALLYVDSSDGDLKVKFGDGTVKTIVTDS